MTDQLTTPEPQQDILAFMQGADLLHKKQAALIESLQAENQQLKTAVNTKQAAATVDQSMIKFAVDKLIQNGWLQESERADAMLKLADHRTALQGIAQLATSRDPLREQLGGPANAVVKTAGAQDAPVAQPRTKRPSDIFWEQEVLNAGRA